MGFEAQVAVVLAAAGSVCLLSLAVLLKLTGSPRSTNEYATAVLTLLGLGAYSIATSFFIVTFTLVQAVWS